MSLGEEPARTEAEIFADLRCLASTPGYAHAIAAICFRDNVIRFGKEPDPASISHQYTDSRLLRTEISTLIGLMVQAPLDTRLPEPQVVQELIDRTDQLMLELHHAIVKPAHEFFSQSLGQGGQDNPFARGAMLREAIFYGGESAYLFQYRDLVVPKYAADNEWLLQNKGFTIEEAHTVIANLFKLQNEKLEETVKSFRGKPPNTWTVLPGHSFTVGELAKRSGLPDEKVRSILNAFTIPRKEKNEGFQSIGDFNIANALPLIRIGEDEYICLQEYSVAEALYDSPFYWMGNDNSYANQAAKHRGQFTENYCADRLRHVFGKETVLQNVAMYRGKNRVGEIDVLVLFADRAIIVEAKSKRLTIEARKGNDNQLQEDFKKGIQSAYEQSRTSAALLTDPAVRMECNGTTIVLDAPISDVYIFCVLADHYPSLAFQSRQFLKIDNADSETAPFVMDVFTLDTMTEMLATPLYFLSYIDRRVRYADRIMASHELTILSYHLKQNLWIENEHHLVQLGDDIGADLDIAMMARREGLPGSRTPDGIMTRFKGSRFGRLISQIEHTKDPTSINLGLLLLSMSENAISQMNSGIDAVCERAIEDGKQHDVTIGIGDSSSGVTIHANFDADEYAGMKLARHCHMRKYSQGASTWYGICVQPDTGEIRFGIALEFPWNHSHEMDEAVKDLPKTGTKVNLTTYVRPSRRKVGRNDACPCGSGRKFKKCCLHRK